ncbi:hypothetical protein C8Q79DRAFT_83870 [Trametes meyenii]|nr:hypothetical protein C8Q79DRAFT_83870 [Trametes meyenii]
MMIPKLNEDIMAMIVAAASREAICRMMQANRFFYHEGPKTLLRDGVGIESNADILKFVRFMLAEDASRSRYLTRLSLSFGEDNPGPEQVSLLTNYLTHMPFNFLRSLYIEECETTLRNHPSLISALKCLSAVQDLAIDECGIRSCEIIREMGASLVTVNLSYDVDPEVDAASVEDVHPLTILKGSSTTLKRLEVAFMGRPLPPSLYPPPFPEVHTLSIGWHRYPEIAPWAHAFTNLRSIDFDTTCDDTHCKPVHLDPHRRANQTDQSQYGSWTALDSVNGTVADIYVKGLACRVARLHLYMKKETFGMLGDVLGDTHPACVDLSVSRAGVLDGDAGLPAVLKRAGAANIEVLKLDILWADADKETDVPMGLELLIASLKLLPIKVLELTFSCFNIPERGLGAQFGMPSTLPPCKVERYFQVASLDALARMFLSDVATLQVVTLGLRGHRTRRGNKTVKVRREELEVVSSSSDEE